MVEAMAGLLKIGNRSISRKNSVNVKICWYVYFTFTNICWMPIFVDIDYFACKDLFLHMIDNANICCHFDN